MKLTVSHLLARFLHEAHVEYIFGVSGHPLFSITDAIYQEPGIDLVPAQMELPGAYMANAYAAAGRRLGACLGSAGPGVTNLLTGVAEARKESVPLIAIGADVDAAVSGRGASSWHELPQAEVMAPVTMLSRTLRDPGCVLEALQEAHLVAVSGRKGPVYLGFPPDVQEAEVEVPDQPWIGPATAPLAADAAAIERAAAALAAAAAPVIITGGGVHWSQAEAEILQLAELLDAPVANPHAHKGILPETHPNVVGVAGYGSYPFADAFVKEADVILAVGLTFSEGMTYGYRHRLIPEGASIVQIDIDAGEIGKIYPVHSGLVGDAKQTVASLMTALQGKPQANPEERRARLRRLRDQKAEWFAEIARRGSMGSGPITHWHVEHAVRQALPADAMVVAAGCTGDILSHFVAPAPVYQSGDFRAIGHGLSSAIGIKHALPNRKVVSITGDGSFMMELSELATAARTGYPDLLVIIDNAAYGGMKRDQIRHHGGRIIGTELLLPNLPALAKAFGLYGRRVSDPGELPAVIEEALAHPGPAVIDAVVPVEGI
jgi:acetolactate synthase-1/2/3 large subunit